jgi:hypothetical protein
VAKRRREVSSATSSRPARASSPTPLRPPSCARSSRATPPVSHCARSPPTSTGAGSSARTAATGRRSRVAETLDAGLYVGEVAPGTRGRHEPLVDDDLWRKVRALRAAKKERLPKGGRRPQEHLLTGGMLHCGGPKGCGQSFYARAYGRSVATYRCRGRDGYNGPPTGCDTPAIPQPLVDNAVRAIVARLEDPRATAREVEDTVKERAAQARKDAKAAASEVAKFEQRLKRARDRLLDDTLSRAEYEEVRAEVEADLTAAPQRQADAEALARDLATNGKDHAQAIRAARELARNDAPSPEQRDRYRAFLETRFEHFTVAVRPALGPPPPDDAPEQERLEYAMARDKRDTLEDALPTAAWFGPWRSKGRGMVEGVLVAKWAPEVEARFAVDLGQEPTLSLEALR